VCCRHSRHLNTRVSDAGEVEEAPLIMQMRGAAAEQAGHEITAQ